MNKNKSIRLKSWLNTKLQAIREEEGFTLIELIVVMAIIAVLVLLAAPNFMGKIQEARVTGIQNDVAVAEDKVSEKLINHSWVENDFQHWPEVDVDGETDLEYLESIRDGDGLYGKGGKLVSTNDLDASDPNITVDEIGDEEYKYIPKEFISEEINSNLGGTFITDGNGTVFYVDKDLLEDYDVDHGGGNPGDGITDPEDVTPGENIPEPTVPVDPNMYEVATDSDFTKTYNSYVGESWIYTGDAEYVIIPEVIQGEPVWNYVKMFENSNVKGVSNKSGEGILNTDRMFYGSIASELDLSGLKLPDVTTARDMFHNTNITAVDLSGMNTEKLTAGNPNTYYDVEVYENILSGSNITSAKVSTTHDAEYMYISTMNQEEFDNLEVYVDNTLVSKPNGYFDEVWDSSLLIDYSSMGDNIEWGYYSDFDETLGYIPWVVDDNVDKNDSNNYIWVGNGSEYDSEYWQEVYGSDWDQMTSDDGGRYYKWVGPRIPNYDDEYGYFYTAWFWN